MSLFEIMLLLFVFDTLVSVRRLLGKRPVVYTWLWPFDWPKIITDLAARRRVRKRRLHR